MVTSLYVPQPYLDRLQYLCNQTHRIVLMCMCFCIYSVCSVQPNSFLLARIVYKLSAGFCCKETFTHSVGRISSAENLRLYYQHFVLIWEQSHKKKKEISKQNCKDKFIRFVPNNKLIYCGIGKGKKCIVGQLPFLQSHNASNL